MTLKRLTDTKQLKWVIDPATGCWNFTGRLNKKGYGLIIFGWRHVPQGMNAHRLSWLRFRGEIPDGLWVLHDCDNPACVNPEHLFLGDNSANMIDMVRKGRGYGQKTTFIQAQEVHRLIAAGTKRRDILELTGVSSSVYRAIRRGETWRHAA